MTRLLRRTVAVAIAVASAVLVSALPAQQVDAPYLRNGDVLRITVWRNPELSGDVPIGDDGTLQHPAYRQVRVAGLPRDAVLARVRESLRFFEVEPQFVVAPLYRISVVGEVRSPNLYVVESRVTVAQAIAMAGGRTERARARAMLKREGQRLTANLDRPEQGVAALPVQSADQIEVLPARTSLTTAVSIASGTLAAITSIILIARR